jgi:hypothetical protein
VEPSSARDTATLRWCARSDGRSGLLFVNNHQRLQPMPAKPGVQFEVRLSDGSIRVPDAPIDIPADCRFFWPFHLQLAGATMRYATAQPICTLQDGTTTYAVFAEIPGIASEFVFAAGSSQVLDNTGSVTADTSTIRIQRPRPGTTPAIRLRTPTGTLAILLLSHDDSLRCWKEELLGQQRLFLTAAGLIVDGRRLRLCADDVSDLAVSILPAPASVTREGKQQNGTPNGVFTSFAAQTPPPTRPGVSVEAVRPAGPLRPIRKGSQGVAKAPSDSDFAQAAVWRLRLPLASTPPRSTPAPSLHGRRGAPLARRTYVSDFDGIRSARSDPLCRICRDGCFSRYCHCNVRLQSHQRQPARLRRGSLAPLTLSGGRAPPRRPRRRQTRAPTEDRVSVDADRK